MIHNISDSDNSLNHQKCTFKKSPGNNFVCRFSQGIHRGKTEQILLTYDLSKETVSTIMMLYKDMKSMVHSLNGDTVIEARVLQGDTLIPFLSILCLDYVLWTSIDWMKENGFPLKKKKKARSWQYQTETISDADDLVLLKNTPTQVESLPHSLEQATSDWPLYWLR